jgi:hypothetical protein
MMVAMDGVERIFQAKSLKPFPSASRGFAFGGLVGLFGFRADPDFGHDGLGP